jgi:hypothetical protein
MRPEYLVSSAFTFESHLTHYALKAFLSSYSPPLAMISSIYR